MREWKGSYCTDGFYEKSDMLLRTMKTIGFYVNWCYRRDTMNWYLYQVIVLSTKWCELCLSENVVSVFVLTSHLFFLTSYSFWQHICSDIMLILTSYLFWHRACDIILVLTSCIFWHHICSDIILVRNKHTCSDIILVLVKPWVWVGQASNVSIQGHISQ